MIDMTSCFALSVRLRGMLSSIITFQMNRPASEPCFKYEPTQEVCKAARHVTWQYNKAHSRSGDINEVTDIKI